jgi:hypothetical protein
LLNGNFDYDDDPTSLISYDDILAIYKNSHAKRGKKYIIADIARYGSDSAIITVWDGLNMIDYSRLDISSTVLLQNIINKYRRQYSVPANNILADEDGVGGGVVDNLKIKGFINQKKAKNRNYQNLKTECAYRLAELIKDINIECDLQQEDKDRINQELGQLKTFDADKDGKLRVLPKSKIKDNIGRSPDWLDIFIMRMYYELKGVNNVIKGNTRSYEH